MSTAATPITGANRRTALVASAVILGLVGSGALVWRSTSAAFTAQTQSASNSWATGTVSLTNDGSAGAVFNVSGLVPGDNGAKCIEAQYTGNVATSVTLYGASLAQTGNLPDYLDLVITQGSGAGANCGSFVADAGGPIYTGTLTDFAADHTDFASGIGTFTPSAAANKVYRIAYTLNAATPNSEQNRTSSVTFTWEAQSGS